MLLFSLHWKDNNFSNLEVAIFPGPIKQHITLNVLNEFSRQSDIYFQQRSGLCISDLKYSLNISMKLKQDLDIFKITLIPHNSSRLLTLWECSLSDNAVLICGPCCICPSSLETILSLATACFIISYKLKKKKKRKHTFK